MRISICSGYNLCTAARGEKKEGKMRNVSNSWHLSLKSLLFLTFLDALTETHTDNLAEGERFSLHQKNPSEVLLHLYTHLETLRLTG